MAAIDIASAAKIIKLLYPDYTVPRELRKNNPFYSLLKKNTNFVGKSVEVPLTINSTQGGGATFAGALAASATAGAYANTYSSFTLTRKTDYSLASIGGEAMKAAVKDEGAMVDLFQDTMDLAMFTAMRSISRHLFRDGTGTIGRVGSIAGAVVTLSTPSDAYNFSLGERISVFTGTGGVAFMHDTVIDNTVVTPITVSAVDRKAGTVTLSAAGTIAAGQYLARSTDRTVATSNATVFTNSNVVTGVKQWLAGSATGAAVGLNVGAFLPADVYGVTRTTDKSSLAGSLLDCTGASPDEAILQLVSDISSEGGRPDNCFMNPRDFASLNKFLGSRVIYERASGSGDDADFGFQAIVLQGDSGPVKCISDINVPQSEIFALQMDSWDLFSLNAAPHILDYDQNNFLRVSDDDAYQIRIGSYANLRCRAPGFNGRGNNFLATTVY